MTTKPCDQSRWVLCAKPGLRSVCPCKIRRLPGRCMESCLPFLVFQGTSHLFQIPIPRWPRLPYGTFLNMRGELHSYCTASNDGKVGFSSQSQKARDAPAHQLPDNGTDCGWAPFDEDNYQQLLGALDYSFLCAYAVGMYLSGIIGERLPIRYYLTFGMLASGAFTALFGVGYFYNIHSFGFYVITQIINGLVQTTGWPSVVTCLGNWFGKGRRGLIMGVWNSHTSVGNILGSLIAGYWVSTCWGLSFIVPGAIVAAMGILCFLFLIEHPKDIACSSSPAMHPRGYENGAHRFRPQKLVPTEKPLDPEMQRPLLSDGKHCGHQNHVVILPADGGGGMAAISFTGALKIPGVIEFSLCLLFAKLVSYTFLFWLPLYITNVAKKPGSLGGACSRSVCSRVLEAGSWNCGILAEFLRTGVGGSEGTIQTQSSVILGPWTLPSTDTPRTLTSTDKSAKKQRCSLCTVAKIIPVFLLRGGDLAAPSYKPVAQGLMPASGLKVPETTSAKLSQLRGALGDTWTKCPGWASGTQIHMDFRE
ncbi:hypothetical protein FD755_014343 [Muntiacus reevesi]|uniref:Major facilitator superfamily (MFS) profile domain-containing protein n=1 Tax=Muntiacus reevesi TaxID=9886 RepID=A0A5N3XLI8_MUNRE|nr:hypothetical protein FD755_014343 [Muntiacus reevesi]